MVLKLGENSMLFKRLNPVFLFNEE